ncbi:hypothetical protein GBA52_005086 [Prunus armeniaca]|nr:hypothetical protein GBA52_005086 [Prunus armeniaca]
MEGFGPNPHIFLVAKSTIYVAWYWRWMYRNCLMDISNMSCTQKKKKTERERSQNKTFIHEWKVRTQLRATLDQVVKCTSNFLVPGMTLIKALGGIIVHTWTSSFDNPRTKLAIIPAVFENVEPLNLFWPHKAAVELCTSPKVGPKLKLKASIVLKLTSTKIIVFGFTMNANICCWFQTIDNFNMRYTPKFTLTHGNECKNQ